MNNICNKTNELLSTNIQIDVHNKNSSYLDGVKESVILKQKFLFDIQKHPRESIDSSIHGCSAEMKTIMPTMNLPAFGGSFMMKIKVCSVSSAAPIMQQVQPMAMALGTLNHVFEI